MLWLLRRALTIWLIFTVTFATVAVIVRIGQKPHPMRVFGLGECDGETCFRGIKFGMDWTKVGASDLNIIASDDYRDLAGITWHKSYLHLDNPGLTTIHFFGADRKVLNIFITPPSEPAPSYKPVPGFTAGDVIGEYGLPCRVLVIRDPINAREPSIPWLVFLLYPKFRLMAQLDYMVLKDDPYVARNFRLPMSLPFERLEITAGDFSDGTGNYVSGSCDTLSEFAGPWRGFAAVEVYHTRNRRDASASRGTQ